jgi:hypothetical protein
VFGINAPGVHGHSVHQSLALFVAAVVWRASVSKRIHKLSGFTLGPNESRFQEMIFRKISAVPDVVIARIVGGTTIAHDAARAAMSYPVAVRSKSHGWMARFSLRGFMFLVRTSREAEPWMRESAVTVHGQSAGPTRLIGHLMPFEQLGDLPQIDNVTIRPANAQWRIRGLMDAGCFRIGAFQPIWIAVGLAAIGSGTIILPGLTR